MATMPRKLKHFQDICTDCTSQKQLIKMQELSLSGLIYITTRAILNNNKHSSYKTKQINFGI